MFTSIQRIAKVGVAGQRKPLPESRQTNPNRTFGDIVGKRIKTIAKNPKLGPVADLVAGLALVAIGTLVLRGIPIGHLSTTTSLLMTSGGGGLAFYAAMRIGGGKLEQVVKTGKAKKAEKQRTVLEESKEGTINKKDIPVARKVVMSAFRVLAVASVVVGVLALKGFLPFPAQLTYALIGAGGGYIAADTLVISTNLALIRKFNSVVEKVNNPDYQKQPYSEALWK